jgi:hypothetical protein
MPKESNRPKGENSPNLVTLIVVVVVVGVVVVVVRTNSRIERWHQARLGFCLSSHSPSSDDQQNQQNIFHLKYG